MNVARFARDREASWGELESLVARAGNKPERLGADGLRRLGQLYRAAAADLAYANRVHPGDPVTRRLAALVVRARAAVYAGSGSSRGFVDLFLSAYWLRLAERRRQLALAAALLILPGLLGALWGLSDASAALGVIPEVFRGAVSPEGAGGLDADQAAAFSTEVLTNNIGVTLLAFAAGILAGIGTAAVLVYNGMILGVVMGIAFGAGNGEAIVRFVFAHGVLELSCIIAAAAAGLSLGWAVVQPGPQTRLAALVAEAREGVLIVIGTAPWLVLAGFVEGLVSRRDVTTGESIALGLLLGGVYWGLITIRGGRLLREQARSRPRTPRTAP